MVVECLGRVGLGNMPLLRDGVGGSIEVGELKVGMKAIPMALGVGKLAVGGPWGCRGGRILNPRTFSITFFGFSFVI